MSAIYEPGNAIISPGNEIPSGGGFANYNAGFCATYNPPPIIGYNPPVLETPNYNTGSPATYTGNSVSGYNSGVGSTYNTGTVGGYNEGSVAGYSGNNANFSPGNPATYGGNNIATYNAAGNATFSPGNVSGYTGNFIASYNSGTENYNSPSITSYNPTNAASYNPPTITGYTAPSDGGGGGGGSVSIAAFMPIENKLAGQMIAGDELMLLSSDRNSTIVGEVISNRFSMQKLLTLVSESGIRLTISDNTPLTLMDGSMINSTEALDEYLPVLDQDGFRWEQIVEVIDAGTGTVATIFCENQCYAAGDEEGKYIFTHNTGVGKN